MRRLLRAIRARRAERLGRDETERLVAGDRAGPGNPGLDHLLEAVRAPATAAELNGEQAMVAALAAERRQAASVPRVPAVPASGPTRRLAVTVGTALVLLGASGTAVAARTGDLPAGFQQSAHRLFSGLGVPAPGTSPPGTSPTRPGPAPATTTPTPTPRPSAPTATLTPSRASWCTAWKTAEAGGHPMNGRDRRDLYAAAGGEQNVARYCASVTVSPSSPTAKKTAKPTKSPKPKRSKKPKE
ncbi:hypothetical protein [Actinoplanes aureus]|uniref:Uncharacterized protein n=1 Tax=Actinoplanes aureus TaxID=2792083 RepID=A0A931G0G1_9ACTN|nr:hypothetical protein [Actinoplanes aureus]MBG0564031.1 hypothetical protein [Actinoplanes aureus]